MNTTFHMEQVVRVLRVGAGRARNLDMSVVAQALLTAVDDVFQAEGAVGSRAKWEPLKDSTIRRNPRRMGGMILHATGRTAAMQPTQGEFWAEVRSPTDHAGFLVSGTDVMTRRDFTAIDTDATVEEVGARLLQELVRF